MAQDWFSYPITEPHTDDDGVDLGTPDNTPVDFPMPGQVIDASYHVYGGQVVVHVDGSDVDEYAIHLNKINVQPGDRIDPGELIGTTGGGVGDLILKNGSVQPATAQSDYQGHSTGYHSEFGLFEDTSPHGDMNQFNKGWGNPSRQDDPTDLISVYHMGGVNTNSPAPSAGSWPPPGDHLIPGHGDVPYHADGSPDWGPWIQRHTHGSTNPLDPSTYGPLIDPGSWFRVAAQAFGFDDPRNMIERFAAGVAGLGLVFIGAMVLVTGDSPSVVIQQSGHSLRKAAEAAV